MTEKVFQVFINLENAAFEGRAARRREVRRLLKQIDLTIRDDGQLPGEWRTLLDVNGNSVGRFGVAVLPYGTAPAR